MRATHVREIRGTVKPGMRAEALRITNDVIFPELAKIPGFARAESLTHGDRFQFRLYFDARLFPTTGGESASEPPPEDSPENIYLSPHALDDERYRKWERACPLAGARLDEYLAELLAKASSTVEDVQMTSMRLLYARDNEIVSS